VFVSEPGGKNTKIPAGGYGELYRSSLAFGFVPDGTFLWR
jgi:hypothetical protein